MKKILISSTAVTAVLAATLMLAPLTASASTPKETFNKMRAALAKAMREGELQIDLRANSEGIVDVTCTLDGKPLPADFPLYVESTREGDILTVDVTADLNPDSYADIRYGKSKTTLELVPKEHPALRSEVVLDPRSMKPTSWTTLVSKDGRWKKASLADLANARRGRAPKSDSTIHAKVKIQVGQDASIRVSGG